jgi:ABC-type dipeptide/oligopeptide/nickel transport system permease component
MGRYIIKRILWLIPVVLGVSILIFTIMYFVPGDPAQVILGQSATQQQIAELHESMGLNDPYIVQLGRFLKETFLEFNLGTSYINKVSVRDSLLQRFPQTAIIALVSCFLQVAIGIPLGVTAAVHHNKWQDRLSVVGAMIGISIPSFWLASMLILLFAFKLRWLPAYGIDSWVSYILPCICAALAGIATEVRYTRTYMLEQIRSDYVVTARAKGMPERIIRYRHALPNTLIPLITGIGGSLGSAFGGTVIIENVFSIPGIGQYIVKAIGNRDYPVVRGSVVVLSIVFSLIMLLVDIAYSFIDPRIKSQYTGRNKRKKV